MPKLPPLISLPMIVWANFDGCINQHEEKSLNSASTAVSTVLALHLNGVTTELSTATVSTISSRLNIGIIDSWKSEGFEVIDFDPQGHLFSVGGKALPSLPECFAIAPVIEPRITGSNQCYLITSYTVGAVSALPSLTYSHRGP